MAAVAAAPFVVQSQRWRRWWPFIVLVSASDLAMPQESVDLAGNYSTSFGLPACSDVCACLADKCSLADAFPHNDEDNQRQLLVLPAFGRCKSKSK